MNKCSGCGHCCVVFNLIPVSKLEVEMKKLEVDKVKDLFPNYEGECELRLKRKRVFWGTMGRWVYVCQYFDVDTRLCRVYRNRPDVCRRYDCEGDERCTSEWEMLCRGEKAQCLLA